MAWPVMSTVASSAMAIRIRIDSVPPGQGFAGASLTGARPRSGAVWSRDPNVGRPRSQRHPCVEPAMGQQTLARTSVAGYDRGTMRHTRRSVIARTRREYAALDRVVRRLRPADWRRRVPRPPTRAPWTVKDAL